ncbi:MAG: hypothetical protein WAV38_00700 [Xanthobacteraceae bacterium]
MARLFALPPRSNSIAVEEVLKASASRHVFGHAAGFPEHEQ